ncbi:MAG: hypothetical protein ACR2OY_08095 [Boseongicola sp.]
MSDPHDPIFLERQSYRRRRLGDAAKLLPVVGAILLLMPILWGGSARTSSGLIFIFVVWAVLIAFIAMISRRLVQDIPEPESSDAPTIAEKLED